MRELSVVLANYPLTKLLKDGTITSDKIKLNFIEFDKVSEAFDAMVETQPYDVCEMAVGTFFQALEFNKPIRLMPIVGDGDFHHGSLYYDPQFGKVTPADLKGAKVAVRAYTQTTALWVRGALSEQFGVKPSDMTFITTEAPHVAEYVNPPYVQFAPESVKDPFDLVKSGECKAIFAGPKQVKNLPWEHVIENHEQAAQEWFNVHHAVPINHMVCCTNKLAEEDPEAVAELYRMFQQAYEMTKDQLKPAVCLGREKIWPTLDVCMDYCVEQGMTSRKFTQDEVFVPGLD